jgi:hypothetical protein
MVSAKVALAGAVVIAVLAGALGALAGIEDGPFTDVGEDHPFGEEISNLADAGIAGGFPDGTYRPNNPVTRASMAAFLNRGLSRGTYIVWEASSATEITADATYISLPTLRILPGATGAGNSGIIVVTAIVDFDINSDTCSCDVGAFLQASTNDFANTVFSSDSSRTDLVTGMDDGQITLTAAIEAEADTVYQFRVAAANNVNVLSGGTNTQFSGSMTAVYTPYGWSGGQQLTAPPPP